MKLLLAVIILFYSIQGISQPTARQANTEPDPILRKLNSPTRIIESLSYDSIMKTIVIGYALYIGNLHFNNDTGPEQRKLLEGIIMLAAEAIERSPDDYLPYYWRANANAGLLNYEKAIKDFHIATKLNPEDGASYRFKANCKKELKDFHGAIQDYHTALNKGYTKDKDLTYINISSCYWALADFPLMLKYANLAIKENPNEGKYFYHKGMANIALDKNKEGCLDLSKAGEMGYSNAYKYIKEFCNPKPN